MMNDKMRTAAIYTTYRPDENFRNRINSVVKSCDFVIVVDNTPGGHEFSLSDLEGCILLQDGRNKGLGCALNIGIREASRMSCDAVVLFDQDSSPDSDFINLLFDGLVYSGKNSIIGPLLLDDSEVNNTGAELNNKYDFEDVTCIATSGMCFYIKDLNLSELFTEDFFLDFVDFDWCWRMRSEGWKILRNKSLIMPHRLGLAQRKFLGLTYHIPAPFRHYFQFRDSLRLAKLGYVPIYSKLRLILILFPKFLLYPFLLDNGYERFLWMARGVGDGLKGVRGVGSVRSIL